MECLAWLRWAWLLVGLLGAIVLALKSLVPVLRYRVNVLYAARSIEREFPELHNDLVNAVLVNPDGTDPHKDLITRSLDKRAGRQMTNIPVDAVFDQQHLVSLATILACLVFVGSLYALLSPKNSFVSAARLFAPWSAWAAPSRVSVQDIECYWATVSGEDRVLNTSHSGNSMFDDRQHLQWLENRKVVELIRGQQVVVSAEINNLREGESPFVVVSSLLEDGKRDQQAKPWKANLRKQADSNMYWVKLPSSEIGLARSVRVTLEAGDARADPFM